MIDELEKVKAEIERLKLCTMDEYMKFYSESAEVEYNALCKIDAYIDSMQKEPVSEELEEASRNYADNEEYGDDMYFAIKAAFKAGVKWKKENLWKSANGDDIPEIDREVVAFQEIFPTDVDAPSLFKIVIAHRPNPNGWNGKSLLTGKVEHYTPETYGKGGWNIPDVKWWLDCLIPKEIEL